VPVIIIILIKLMQSFIKLVTGTTTSGKLERTRKDTSFNLGIKVYSDSILNIRELNLVLTQYPITQWYWLFVTVHCGSCLYIQVL
jgi:hypothetical protein